MTEKNMQLVFNELSLSKDKIDVYTTNLIIKTFLHVYSQVQTNCPFVKRGLLTPCDFNDIELFPGYNISKWRNSSIDPDDKRRLLGICDRQNVTSSYSDEILVEYQGEAGLGFNIAHENDYPLISFSFSEKWKQPCLVCSVTDLQFEEIYEKELINFSDAASCYANDSWMETRGKEELNSINTASAFISCYNEIFPSLIFLDNAIDQINNQVECANIPTIVEKLMKLEKFFSQWDGNGFDTSCFPKRLVSPESKETLSKYRNEHTYKYGESTVVVSYHMRYTGGDIPGRIYFFPDHERKKGVICSLHTKLPTVSDPKFKR